MEKQVIAAIYYIAVNLFLIIYAVFMEDYCDTRKEKLPYVMLIVASIIALIAFVAALIAVYA